ncbi:uncharacterized protein LOC129953216 [Eupeodes corollae]|uniref:uncharacterized protein LOC129953216 n=1 Tax=Eupeodes corollae TaxID=290404 RepID=UPI00248FCF2A|nr:uncharacterized protein LOC129953216 [Eupeodes corollae]
MSEHSHSSLSQSKRIAHSLPHNQEYTEQFNCVKCDREDSFDEMVQCDKCDHWYHFVCADVHGDDVEDKEWICPKCLKTSATHLPKSVTSRHGQPAMPKGQKQHVQASSTAKANPPEVLDCQDTRSKPLSKAAHSECSRKSRSSVKSVQLQLKKLEEERLLQEKRDREYLQKKYEILEQLPSDNDEDIDDDLDICEIEDRTSKWVETVKRTTGDSPARKPSKLLNPQPQITSHTLQQIDENPTNPNNAQDENAQPLIMRSNEVGTIPGHTFNAPKINSLHLAARHAMPKELPSFSGNPEDWPLFISCLENSTRSCGYTNDENLMRLQRCLKGKALEAVRYRLLYPENVPSIISTLQMLYGRPDVIIHSLLNKIRNEPAPRADRLDTLVTFSFAVQNIHAIMESKHLESHIANPSLLQELTEKLPASIRLNWGIHKQTLDAVNLSTFCTWLSSIARAAVEVSPSTPFRNTESKFERRSPSTKTYLNTHQEIETRNKPSRKCKICNGNCDHVENCHKFISMTLKNKWSAVNEFHLCRTCLRPHGKSRCTSTKKCGQNGCVFKHHSLLHKFDTDESTPSTSINSNKNNQDQNSTNGTQFNCHVHKSENRLTIFRIIPITLYSSSARFETFAFLDDGSSITLMDEELASILGLDGEAEPLCLKWTSDTHRMEEGSQKVSVKISGTGIKNKYELSNVRTVKSLDLPSQSIDADTMKDNYRHLKGIPISSYLNAKPRILIGLDHWNLAVSLRTREGKNNEPVVTKTRLGWVVHGVCEEQKGSQQKHYNFHVCECQPHLDDELHQLVKKQFNIENVDAKSVKKLFSTDDTKAKQILETQCYRDGNRFIVPLLWRNDNDILPDSRRMAERRLKCLESRMSKEPALATKLQQEVAKYLKKGYARKLSKEESDERTPRTWYLPVFPVLNPSKPNKVRMVWDAAAKVDGVSLNSVLLSGPDTLPSLAAVLYRFRERKIGICADIREMFHQILINRNDQNAQRFLWRNPTTKQIEEYIMRVMIFGATCSPYCAQFVKNKNATEYLDDYPRAAKAIIENHYVDDYLDSVDSEDEAVELARAVKYIHSKAGFDIHNFISNSPNVLRALNAEINDHTTKNITDGNISNSHEKILGMWWSNNSDTFSFLFKCPKLKPGILSGQICPTKREVLRSLMSIFDPLGLITNFLVRLKILLREIWRSSVQWDEKIREQHFVEWCDWVDHLPMVQRLVINRPYINMIEYKTKPNVQLHVFVDASENAFAAVAYLRFSSGYLIECALVGAKAKVAPLKDTSIPRLELEAAVLGVRLSKSIREGHSISIDKIIFWSDSKTVLYWIRSEDRRYKHFVAFRIGEIIEASDPNDWRWIPTKENVADEATKWKRHMKFESECRWYKGPSFLYQQEDQWPRDESLQFITVEEARVNFVQNVSKTNASIIEYTRFSKWNRLLRSLAYVFKFIDIKCRKRAADELIPLSTDDLKRAQNYLYRQCQLEAYPAVVAFLKNKQNYSTLEETNPLYQLSPYMDSNDVIRINGRIDAANDIPYDTKRPIILPKHHYVTHLIIDAVHQRLYHQHSETVINELKQLYYITSLRTTVRKVINKCQDCRNKKSKPIPPLMGELPPSRLKSFNRPFSYIGIDYFGPMNVKVGRHLEKRWGVIITCMTIRAIHIEVAHSLSTDSCILAIKRFMARRGTPLEITSDNGTNFRGASRELKDAVEQIDHSRIANEFVSADLRWRFIPPASPHMGGSWERMVRSVKQVLANMQPSRNPSDEILLSMMAEVENIINSRPLTYVPLDCDSDEALTPNHFLLGSSSGKIHFGEFNDDSIVLKKGWMTCEQFANSFWRRWVQEYLPTLTKRTKWFNPTRPISIGDVVIVVDKQFPRNQWPKGVVTKVFPGKDGQVRSALVQTSSGCYTRPATKLAILDVNGPGLDLDGNQEQGSSLPGGSVGKPGNADTSQLKI